MSRNNKLFLFLSYLLVAAAFLALVGCGPADDAAGSPDPSSAPTATPIPEKTVARLRLRLVNEDEEETPWSDNLEVHDGDVVELKTTYFNYDDATHYNVLVHISLPGELEYIPGSTVLVNNTYGELPTESDAIVAQGVIIGHYEPVALASRDYSGNGTVCSAYLTIRATVRCDSDEPVNVLATADITAGPDGSTPTPIAAGAFLTVSAAADPEASTEPSDEGPVDIASPSDAATE